MPEGLTSALAWLDGLLERAAAAARELYGPEAAGDPYRGLLVGHDEPARLLAREPGLPLLHAGHPAGAPSLAHLRDAFELSDFDVALCVIAIAPELDLRYERLYGYLQDDVGRRHASVDLALNLLCADTAEKLKRRAHLAPDAPLIRHGVIELAAESRQPEPPLLARQLRFDEQLVALLLGHRAPGERLAHAARLVDQPAPGPDVLAADALDRVRAAAAESRRLSLWLDGVAGSAAEALAAALGRPLLELDGTRRDADAAVPVAVRYARFTGALLHVRAIEALDEQSLLDAVGRAAGPVLLSGATHARVPADLCVALPAVSVGARREGHRRALAGLSRRIEPVRTWDDLVLGAEPLAQLRELCAWVRHRPRVHGEWGFQRRLGLSLGITALFSGAPGTGKTLAAEVIAGDLGLDLYRIDLAGVVSKYIGETEKNLARVFDGAQDSGAILLFDEADALFGKRTEVRDSHDRFANIEISYLLQRMEEYDGLAILTTNRRRDLDEAFMRRLQFAVDFPLPDVADRRRIWTAIWPPDTPRSPDVDVDALASRFELPGGNIRNIALAAAFLAAADGQVVTMTHVLAATRREYRKLGMLADAGQFDQAD